MVDVRHLPYFSLFLGGEGSFSRLFSNNLEYQYCGIMGRLFHLKMVYFVVVNNVEEINNEINRKHENL